MFQLINVKLDLTKAAKSSSSLQVEFLTIMSLCGTQNYRTSGLTLMQPQLSRLGAANMEIVEPTDDSNRNWHTDPKEFFKVAKIFLTVLYM